MSARLFGCPIPGCGWSWRETARPVGDGPEFEQRLAQRARLRDRVITEHEQEHQREDDARASARLAGRRLRHLSLVVTS